MSDQDDLHTRLEALEKRISEARRTMPELTENRRQGLGALVEAISEQLDRYEHGQ